MIRNRRTTPAEKAHNDPGPTGPRIVDTASYEAQRFSSPGHPLAARHSGGDPQKWEYPWGWNLNTTPRREESRLTTFQKLEELARANDLVKSVIGFKADTLAPIDWAIMAREGVEVDVSRLVESIVHFVERPNRLENRTFPEWVKGLVWEQSVTDAVSIAPVMDRAGRPHSWVQVDGKTIKPLITAHGLPPQYPASAYQQILHGLPAGEYTSRELYYKPSNPQKDSPYGCSPVEKVMVHIMTGISMWSDQLSVFDDGTLPQVYVEIPDGHGPDEAQKWVELLNDTMVAQRAMRFRFVALPPGANVREIKGHVFSREQSEWVARMICFAFGVSPTQLVAIMNRATAEVSETIQYEAGIQPLKGYVENVVNDLIRISWGDEVADLVEFRYVSDRTEISMERASTLALMQNQGWIKPHWISEQVLGQEPDEDIRALPVGPVVPAGPDLGGFGFGGFGDESPALPADVEADVPVDLPGGGVLAEVSFNDLRLALEPAKQIGDTAMVNLLRAEMARRMGAAPLPPIPVTSDVEDEITVEETKEGGPVSLSAGIKADLGRWRKVANKSRQRGLGFVSEVIPGEVQEEIREALADGGDVEEIFKAHREQHKREGERRFRGARDEFKRAAEALLRDRKREILEEMEAKFRVERQGIPEDVDP